MLEKASLEITDGEGRKSETEKWHEKIKKQKAELDRKDTTIDMLRGKLKAAEERASEFEVDIKDRQSSLTRDLHDLSKKSESYLKKLRRSEISITSLKSIVLTVYKHLKDKCNDSDRELDLRAKFNHSEAMKLLDLSETELNMFINSPQDNTSECGLVRLLDMEDIESEEISRMIINSVNSLIKHEMSTRSLNQPNEHEESNRHNNSNVRKKYED